ncbi:MAG: sigma 54-interacting transcriptional regulator [Gracilibacteraceae bacterium]|nr:sigma 54-interacting transcriptional regulator [Gracilibacteraceae bacterium]
MLQYQNFPIMNERDFFRSVFDSMTDGVIIANKEGQLVYANEAYATLYGKPLEELIGKKLTELVKNPLIFDVIASGKPKEGIRLMIRGNKETYLSISPVFNKEGEIICGVTIFKEVEDLRRKMLDYRARLHKLRDDLHTQHQAYMTFDDIIGDSAAIRKTVTLARQAAEKNHAVLLQGESGTGKDAFAQAIHNAGFRTGRPFVALNCACLSENLVESELFGYVSGAFTGAAKGGKPGLFEIADGGTLFLDEIGDLKFEMQAKLLRTLETGEFSRVGGTKPINVNVRLICATHQNIEKMVYAGTFREDLYYRLSVLLLEIPALRERPGDIEGLAEHFLKAQNDSFDRFFHPDTLAFFHSYPWPGNIRELRNTISAILCFTDSNILRPEHLPPRLQRLNSAPAADVIPLNPSSFAGLGLQKDSPLSNHRTRQDLEASLMASKIKIYGHSVQAKKRIAQEMGISLATLYNKMRFYGLTGLRSGQQAADR